MHAHHRLPRSRRVRRSLVLDVLEDRCLLSSYALTDLGANLIPTALNNNGQVAGEFVDTSAHPNGGAFLWSQGTLTTLSVLGNNPLITGLNDSDQVVGDLHVTTGNPAFLLSNGVLTSLPLAPTAINDAGDIAGNGDGAEVLENGTLIALDPTASYSYAEAISGNGLVAGYAPGTSSIAGDADPWVWNPATGQATDLGGGGAEAFGVNNSGQATGFDGLDNADFQAFFYSNGKFQDIGQSQGNAINNAGLVVGQNGADAFIYGNGVATDLNSLIPAGSGFTLNNAVAINNSGQILVQATDASGTEHAVLLTPAPTPSFVLTSVPSSTTAGSAFTVTVTATNPNGTTDTGYTGTVQFTSTDPQAVLPANYTFTTADQGVHTFTATLKTAGSQSLTVTDTTNPAIAGTQTGITVSPAAASHLVIFTFGSTFAGSALPADVTAEDPYGNTAAGYTGTVHFTSSDPQAVLPANYTFTAANAGVADLSVTLKTAGTQSFTVTDTSTPSLTATASHITVLPLQATHFVISGPTSVAPGAAFNITVIALDPYGNDATSYFGTVSFTSSDSLATLPKNYTFKTTDKGEHTFSRLKLQTQGKQTITVMDTQTKTILGSITINVT
jgi:hypothetical protein